MLVETLLGGALGTLSRLAPAVLEFLGRKDERKHELALGAQQLEVAKLNAASARDIKDLDVEQSQFVTAMNALKSGIEAQGEKTGIKWVDALSSIVRPAITGWVFALYSLVKLAALYVALQNAPAALAILSIWGPEDASMLSAIMMFWFVGRVWDRSKN